jgi:hypothetical protein
VPGIKIWHLQPAIQRFYGVAGRGENVTEIRIVPGIKKRTMLVHGALVFCTSEDCRWFYA